MFFMEGECMSARIAERSSGPREHIAAITDDELRARWKEVGRNLSGERLISLSLGADPASSPEAAYVDVRNEMSRRKLL